MQQPGAPGAAAGGAPAAAPAAGSEMAGQAGAVAGQVAGQGLAMTKSSMKKGMNMVKEMDSGTLGIVIKVMNLVTGLVVGLYSGVFLLMFQVSSIGCDFSFDGVSHSPGGACCAVAALAIPEADPSAPPPPPATPTVCAIEKSFFWNGNFGVFVIASYMIPFGAILFFYELTTKRSGASTSAAEGGQFGSGKIGSKINGFRASLTKYFGFIFFYRKRMQFMIFVGILCLGNINNQDAGWSFSQRNWGPPIAGGIMAMLNALFHFIVRMQHPEFDKGMQDQLAAANDIQAGQYTSDIPVPAAAPSAPTYNSGAEASYDLHGSGSANIYGSAQADDGGTAI